MLKSSPDILKNIILQKEIELAKNKERIPLSILEKKILTAPKPRDFYAALEERVKNKQTAIIAEIKKASPSKGIICKIFDPVKIAKAYQKAGAACLSVLTDEQFFQGHNDYLIQAKEACELPILRKDFIIDAYQVFESRALGADCILLIAACLSPEKLAELYHLANELNLCVLIEVHDEEECEKALELKPYLLGINNRNLRTFTIDIHTTLNLLPKIKHDCLIVSESGIYSSADILLMQNNNVYAFLVGESLLRDNDPEGALQKLLSP